MEQAHSSLRCPGNGLHLGCDKSDKMKSLLFKADSQKMAQVLVAKIEECISELAISVLECV